MNKFFYTLTDSRRKIWAAIKSSKPLSENQVYKFGAQELDMDVSSVSSLFDVETVSLINSKNISGWVEFIPDDEINCHRCSRQ